jgi:large subunit ribosomal protein L5
MSSDLKKEYTELVIPALMKSRGITNPMRVPKITKVVINCSVGSAPDIKTALDDAAHEITTITGQKPIRTKSTKSISNFKLREGQEIGLKVTLRGQMMYDFLLRLIRLSLPRIRDFRGVPTRAFDGRGGYTLGIKDHTIFPEIELDKIKRTIGMDVTIVTTGKNKEETKELLNLLGMPFADRAKQQQAAAAAAAA